ncbi:uncharacterized protein LOC123672192 [Harmonia axyridis]|uniref:uncharacterized protein LOC123672192 n=1 Tax=Harmonia axyridis TaxID=115357 RepID=UPI001E277250|nr:uncharacterized protein LOC123672192 [Harmonia axyridis]
MAIQITQEQLDQLFGRNRQRSFAACTARYSGEKDLEKVREFLQVVDLYKSVEGISDKEALDSLPLVLTGEAITWWRGIGTLVKTWKEAKDAIETQFAPKREAYKIFRDIFATPQREGEPLDAFLNKKRSLLAEITAVEGKEELQLDLVYSLINISIRSRVPRNQVTNFQDLLTAGRRVEEDLGENRRDSKLNKENDKRKKCTFCKFPGHNEDECRKKKRQFTERKETPTRSPENTGSINCYGCGRPGVMRRNCPTCNPNSSDPYGFCALHMAQVVQAAQPTQIRNRAMLALNILGIPGTACIDTGARISVAGASLYHKLQQKKVPFSTINAHYRYADGKLRTGKILTCRKEVRLEGKKIPTSFIVLPHSPDNRTLLGMNFLQDAGLVLDIAGGTWFFRDHPNRKFSWFSEEDGKKINPPQNSAHSVVASVDVESQRFYKPRTEGELIEEHRPSPMYCPSPSQQRWMWEAAVHDVEAWWDETMDISTLDIVDEENIDLLLRDEECSDFSSRERNYINKILIDNRNLFREIDTPCTGYEHRIDVGNHAPVASPPYRLTPQKTAILREEIDKMLQEDVIEESDSPWASPVVMVPKPGGGTRICIDYRKVNAITRTDTYPLPRIDDLLQETRGHTAITTLDLRAGYWQIPVHPDDRDKTSFITPFGTYRFKRMPFGLKNASASFQRMIDRVRRSRPNLLVLAYLDDLVLLSVSTEQHITDMKELFQTLAKYNLRLNRDKCQLGCKEVKLLGHIISPQGIKANPDKVAAIRERPRPTNLKQLQSFLQACSWFRKFIAEFSQIARPLTNLTKKNVSWHWSNECQNAFETLRERLVTMPVLRQVDTALPFILRTDASQYALGAVLLQGPKNEKRRPVPNLVPGTLIWVNTKLLSKKADGFSSKLAPRRDGPYVIKERRGPTSYAITNQENPDEVIGVYHASDLTPCKGLENKEVPTHPIRRRGRPKKTIEEDPGLLAETSSQPEGEPVTPISTVRRSERLQTRPATHDTAHTAPSAGLPRQQCLYNTR